MTALRVLKRALLSIVIAFAIYALIAVIVLTYLFWDGELLENW